MLALAIVIAVLVLIALLRFGVSVLYSSDGLLVKAFAGPFSLLVYPRKEKQKKETEKDGRKKRGEKKRLKKEKGKKEKEKKEKEKKPGGLQSFLEILSVVKTALSRFRRRLLIKRLTLYVTAANDDPFKTAMMFGGANAAFGAIIPVLDKLFRIKRRDLQAFVDFTDPKPRVYLEAAFSLALWETVYIAVALLPLILKKQKPDGSAGKKNQPSNQKSTQLSNQKSTQLSKQLSTQLSNQQSTQLSKQLSE